MSATQIPDLNFLRRGGGRGRPKGRGASLSSPPRSRDGVAKDRVVQGTDSDASISRLSAVRLGYLEDPFAALLTSQGVQSRKLPIINRGTYVRTIAIDQLVTLFIDSARKTNKRPQVISLGAGSDTRVFRLLASSSPFTPTDLVYHEIDFAVNTSAKIRKIRSSPLLWTTLQVERPEDVTISAAGDALHSPKYHIHPLDLRSLASESLLSQAHAPTSISTTHSGGDGVGTLESNKNIFLPDIDPGLPTLLISECCLVYLSPREADGVVKYFTNTLFARSSLGLILYEPIRPDDAFGRTMVANLSARGIHLQTLHRYASLAAQRTRLAEQGFTGGQAAADVDFIWERWVNEAEKDRVAGLEMLDELEEWKLLAQHYCVAWGWREQPEQSGDADGSGVFDEWKTVEAQEADRENNSLRSISNSQRTLNYST